MQPASCFSAEPGTWLRVGKMDKDWVKFVRRHGVSVRSQFCPRLRPGRVEVGAATGPSAGPNDAWLAVEPTAPVIFAPAKIALRFGS